MRKWVDRYLSEIAKKNTRIRLIIADVGDFPTFSQNHPDKFLNVGVSESNAIGVAAGLASEGFAVYVYGVSSFFLYRAYEQLKYSVAYWKQNVTFIGVGFGWKYYNIGIGHFCPDDILLVQSLPFFEIYTPYNLAQLLEALKSSYCGPKYLRLTANIIEAPISYEVMETKDNMLITYGEMVKTCLCVINKLYSIGLSNIGLLPLKALNESEVHASVDKNVNSHFFVVEDQFQKGGLYPVLKDRNVSLRMHISLPVFPNKVADSRDDLLKAYSLDDESVFSRIKNELENE